MKTLTGVSAVFCAAHRGTGRRDVLHGHSYEVTAWFIYEGQDAEALQEKLHHFLQTHFDHSTLQEESSRGENIANLLVVALGAYRVEVRRPLERIYAECTR